MANEIAALQKDVTDQINTRIQGLQKEGLKLPVNYSPSNALKSAWFAIKKAQAKGGKPALEVVTKESLANTLLNMVIQGLSPAKTQAYFIVRGNELQMERSYFGTQAVLKRLNGVDDIWAEVVHEGDDFEIGSEDGRLVVTNFKPKFENQDKGIIGVFAVVKKTNGEKVFTVMTNKEIEQAWSHRSNSGAVQKEFPQEMAKRTIINRAAKNFINTSDDSDLLVDAINETTSNEYDNDNPRTEVVATETPNSDVNDLLANVQNEVEGEQADANGNTESEGQHGVDTTGEPVAVENTTEETN